MKVAATEAHKDIDAVIAVQADLFEVVQILRPVALSSDEGTYYFVVSDSIGTFSV